MEDGKLDMDIVRKIVAIQYCYDIGHRLMKLGDEFDVQVVFKYQNKLGGLAAKTGRRVDKCKRSGHGEFVSCVRDTVYEIPLSCNKVYIGQSGRCINQRLYEHKKTTESKKKIAYNSLSEHLTVCEGCKPLMNETKIIGRNGSRRVRELVEAAHICRRGENAISNGSVEMSKMEADYITRRRWERRE